MPARMGRLFLFAVALCWVGIVVSGRHPAARRVIPAAADAAVPAPNATPLAYHPGEPSLALDDAARLTRAGNGHFQASVAVNGQPVDMVVDTGATAVALTVADARALGLTVDPSRFSVVGTGASGPVVGQAVTLADVALGERHVAGVEAVVLAGLDRSLLGQSYLRRLDHVEISGDTMTLR